MKVWLYSLLGLIIFIFLSVRVQHYLISSSDELTQIINQTDQAVQSKIWLQAKTTLHQFEKNWKKTKASWSLLLNHQEVDNIEQSLIRSKRAITAKDYSNAQLELGSLKNYITHVPKKEALNWTNVL